MSKRKAGVIVEPKVNGKPISYVKTMESLEEARAKYRDRADGLFDHALVSGSRLSSHIRHLESSINKLAGKDFDEHIFGTEEYEDAIKALTLSSVVFHGWFTWRGKGGNYRPDDRFDAEEIYDETDETKLRLQFVNALLKYATAGASKADYFGNLRIKDKFLSVLPSLKKMTNPDPEAGWTRAEARKIARRIYEASQGLWSELQLELQKQGEILSQEEVDRLYRSIYVVLGRIEKEKDSAVAQIEQSFIIKDQKRLAQGAIGEIRNIILRELLPLAVRYGNAEEADFFDVTSATKALDKLCRVRFCDSKADYEAAQRCIESIEVSLHHPVSVYSEGVFDYYTDGGMEKHYAIMALEQLYDFVGKCPNADVKEAVKEVFDEQKEKEEAEKKGEYNYVVQVIKEVRTSGVKKRISWEAAMRLVRFGKESEFSDKSIFEKCVEARTTCLKIASKKKNKSIRSEDGVWNTCLTYAKTPNWPNRTKGRKRSGR